MFYVTSANHQRVAVDDAISRSFFKSVSYKVFEFHNLSSMCLEQKSPKLKLLA